MDLKRNAQPHCSLLDSGLPSGVNDHSLNHVLERIECMERAILKRLIMTQEELAAALETVDTNLEAVGAQLTKAQAEITKQIADLKAALGGNTTPAVDAALTKLQAAVATITPISQSLDDVTPDVPPTP